MGFERRKAAELTEMAFAGKLWATRVGNDNEGRRVPTEEEWICQWFGAHKWWGPLDERSLVERAELANGVGSKVEFAA